MIDIRTGELIDECQDAERDGVVGLAYYLDSIAKSPDYDAAVAPFRVAPGDCGGWAAVGSCPDGHSFAKILRCGREWCLSCGQIDSDAHQRRWVRWLPKVRQLREMGYLVVTFPPEVRGALRTSEQLSAMGRAVTAALRSLGFARGLRRWHWFGDESTTYHPHLNFLLDSGHIDPSLLNAIKLKVAIIVGFPCVVHYEYRTTPAEIVHTIKYVTRPTFTDRTWDQEMAGNLFGFRNCWAWGHWDGEPLWDMKDAAEVIDPSLVRVVNGLCARCGGSLTWAQRPVSSLSLGLWGATLLGAGYYQLPDGTLHVVAELVSTPYLVV
jgi:hypothetical protein